MSFRFNPEDRKMSMLEFDADRANAWKSMPSILLIERGSI